MNVVKSSLSFKVVALGFVLAAAAGCKSSQDKANDAALNQAKQQAASTGVAQQVLWKDTDGNTVTTVVQPPAPGQTTEQITVTKSAQSTATATVPVAAGGPVVSALGSNGPATNSLVSPNGPNGPANGPVNGPANGPANGAGYGVAAPAPNPSGPTVTAMAPASIEVPRGTTLSIRINQRISVKQSFAGQPFSGEVVRDVIPQGTNQVAIPRGTPVGGVIDEAHRRGHFKGRSILELRLTSMQLGGQRYNLDTRDNVQTKKGKGKRSAAFIGGGTGLGMLAGGLAGGGVGLLVGGLAGGGLGTGIAGLTGNRDIEIPAESVMNFTLADDLAVQPLQ